jgi:hypothetical protein
VKLALLLVLLIAPAVGYGALSLLCPCSRVPGGHLIGGEVEAAVSDWSFVNDVPLCQLEVASVLPHSINLNCMSTGGELYVSCSNCKGKHWSSIALEKPGARLRAGDAIYPVTLTRVEDAPTLDKAWQARASKTQASTDAPRPDHWWSFRLVSR